MAMHDVDGLCDLRALLNRDDDAVVEESRIERKRRVVSIGRDRADFIGEFVALGERASERKNTEPRLQRREVRKLRHECTVHQHQPARIDARKRVELLRFLDRTGIRRRRKGCGFPHQRAQIGIFPLLDPPVRQSAFEERRRRFLAEFRERFRARKLRARRLDRGGKRLLGGRADGLYFGIHGFTRPVRKRHNPFVRVQGRVPARRSARFCPSPSHARHRARCSREAADSG